MQKTRLKKCFRDNVWRKNISVPDGTEDLELVVSKNDKILKIKTLVKETADFDSDFILEFQGNLLTYRR